MKITLTVSALLVVGWIVLCLPAWAASNRSESNDNQITNLQAQIDAIVPLAPKRFPLHPGKQNLVSSMAMEQFSQTKTQNKQVVTVRLPGSQKQLSSNVEHQLSAIGVKIHRASEIIYYIDPNSDLCGKTQLGDRLLTINGIDTDYACASHTNFGNEQSQVDVAILTHGGELKHLLCYRHSVAYFSPSWQCIANYPH